MYHFETKEIQEYDVWLVKSPNRENMGGNIEKPSPQVRTFVQFPKIIGGIFLSHNMRQTTIWLDNETQIQMSGPASTREKVINIKNDILNYR